MNFLAHLFLSGKGNAGVLVGGFIADQVKGRQMQKYGKNIRAGIALHRMVDEFTDHHSVVRQSKERLRPVCGRYSGVFVDVVYDHFLAVEWSRYSDDNLSLFCTYCYFILMANWFRLPSDVKDFLPFIVFRRRLTKYKSLNGLQESFEIMSRHTSLPPVAKQVVELVRMHYAEFSADFNLFFPQLISFVEEEKKILFADEDDKKQA